MTATPTSNEPRRASLAGAKLREAGWGYAFVAVPMIVFGLFFLYPFGYAIYISFYKWGILGKTPGSASVGFANYSSVLHDSLFHTPIVYSSVFLIAVWNS